MLIQVAPFLLAPLSFVARMCLSHAYVFVLSIVACTLMRALIQVDVDDPDRRLTSGEHPEYRTVTVANASTPPVQKIVWLLINVPSPQLLKNGHIVAEWEMDVEELQKKQGQNGSTR